MKDFNHAIAFLGEWGLFQKIIFSFYCVSLIPNGFSLGIVFVADTPKHQCFIPEVNLTQEWLQAAIPVSVADGVEELSRCSRYSLDLLLNLSAQGVTPGDVNLTDLQQEPCVDGWSYSKDFYQSTIVTEFDLVCDNQWKQPLTTTVFFVGILIGSFVFGLASDRFGRKPVFFSTMAVQALFMFFQIFSTSWTTFTILMLFCGIGNVANYISAYVAGAEIFSGNVRVLYMTLGSGLAFAIGYLMMPLSAYFLRDWRSLQLVISLPSLAFLPFWRLIPESPRWLLSRGRVEEAEAIVRKAAAMNKVVAPPLIFENEEEFGTDKEKHATVFDLVRTDNIRTATVVLCLLWLCMSAGYWGVSLNASKLTPDPYLGNFISAVVEIPAYVGSWLCLKHISRRLCTVGVMLLGGVCLLLLSVVPPSLRWLSITLEMIGKFCFAGTTNILYAYTAEVFPTVLRNTATGVCSTSARIGSCLAPFITQLNLYFTFLPPVLLGTLSAVAAFGAFFLPETLGKPLPETIEDMQQCQRMRSPCSRQKTTTETVCLESKF